ncbi:MAG: hypothetical protein AAF667_13680 [Pseudomonadota bacterium]
MIRFFDPLTRSRHCGNNRQLQLPPRSVNWPVHLRRIEHEWPVRLQRSGVRNFAVAAIFMLPTREVRFEDFRSRLKRTINLLRNLRIDWRSLCLASGAFFRWIAEPRLDFAATWVDAKA